MGNIFLPEWAGDERCQAAAANSGGQWCWSCTCWTLSCFLVTKSSLLHTHRASGLRFTWLHPHIRLLSTFSLQVSVHVPNPMLPGVRLQMSREQLTLDSRPQTELPSLQLSPLTVSTSLCLPTSPSLSLLPGVQAFEAPGLSLPFAQHEITGNTC